MYDEMRYYAMADANGPISVELKADNLGDAIEELRALSGNERQNYIDEPYLDLENALGLDATGMDYNDFCVAVKKRGAEHVYSEGPTPHDWEIWALA